jgi:hypothetical protein
MNKKYIFIVTAFILPSLLLSACNLPNRTSELIASLPPTVSVATSTPTPAPSLCDNLYYPNSLGNTWEYTGSTSATGTYTRSDAIISSVFDAFSVQSSLSGIIYNVDYSCTEAGLLSVNPIQQYLGAILNRLSDQISLTLVSNSGISLPRSITPGDTWQQIVQWEGSAQAMSTTGRLVFD